MRFRDSGNNPWPQPFGELEDARVEQIRKRLKRASEWSHPTSMTTTADRIMGEVAIRYQLPQDVKDLLYEREVLREQMRSMESLIQDTAKPQEKPPTTDRRLRP